MSFPNSKPKQNIGVETEPTADPDRAAGGVSAGSTGVHGLQRLLEERLLRPAELPPAVADQPLAGAEAPQKPAPPKSRLPGRLIKALLGLAIVAIFGFVPLRAIMQASSVEAIVNSRVVTVRAPIAGEVQAAPTDLSQTGVIGAGEILMRIVNVRADRVRLDDLSDRLGEREIERVALQSKIASAERSYDALTLDVERFTEGRIAQLEASTAQLASEIAAAGARREVAAAAAARALSLMRTGSVAAAEAQRLTRERTIAEQSEIGARRELDAANVELEAARDGAFIGDSYNDRPSSAQRRDVLRERLDELAADLAATKAGIAQLQRDVALVTARYQDFSDVAISLPVAGRVWEVLTAPGEQVRAGQDLLKLLDCSGAVVTANVTEGVYNSLSVGAPARFRPTDGGGDLQGVVMNLTGFADAPANLAIGPSALDAEAYRVTVQVPELAARQDCAVGRTGRVIFDRAPADAP